MGCRAGQKLFEGQELVLAGFGTHAKGHEHPNNNPRNLVKTPGPGHQTSRQSGKWTKWLDKPLLHVLPTASSARSWSQLPSPGQDPPQRFHAAPWRPKGTEPVGRGEAVILEAALNEMLPPGAITAKYAARDGARATAAAVAATAQEAVQGRRSAPARGGGSLTATLSPVQEFLAGQDIGKDYDMLEMILMEAARQVGCFRVFRGLKGLRFKFRV